MEGVRISLGTTLVGPVKWHGTRVLASLPLWLVSAVFVHKSIQSEMLGLCQRRLLGLTASSSSSGSYHTVDAIDPSDLADTVGEHGISHTELGVHVTDVVCVPMLAGLGTHAISSGTTSKCTNEPHLSLVHAHS